jgi:hypothetical protein
MLKKRLHRILLEKGAEKYELARRLLARLPQPRAAPGRQKFGGHSPPYNFELLTFRNRKEVNRFSFSGIFALSI